MHPASDDELFDAFNQIYFWLNCHSPGWLALPLLLSVIRFVIICCNFLSYFSLWHLSFLYLSSFLPPPILLVNLVLPLSHQVSFRLSIYLLRQLLLGVSEVWVSFQNQTGDRIFKALQPFDGKSCIWLLAITQSIEGISTFPLPFIALY